MSDFTRLRSFLKELKQEDLNFKDHFYRRTRERPIDEAMVRKYLPKIKRLLRVEKQPARMLGEEKFRIWIELSKKYCLVLIIAISGKTLNIITGWNTQVRWQKSIQK